MMTAVWSIIESYVGGGSGAIAVRKTPGGRRSGRYTSSMHSGKSFAFLRVAFGFVWAIDAYFKWQPGFLGNFTGYLTDAMQGQPALVQGWIQLWVNFISVDPYLFAVIVAIGETAIALALIFGFFTRGAIAGGTLLSLVIWATAEGFGGPYVAGATDIGSAIIYVFVFAALWTGKSWQRYSIDSLIARR